MLTRWNEGSGPRWTRDPVWGALTELRREMDRLFADPQGAAQMGAPMMEVSDEAEAIVLKLDVPGFAEDDIDIDLNRGSLTVRGERTTEVPEGYAVHRQERSTLSFSRTMTLPCRVDADGVEATLRDGVLELRLPKAAEEQPRTIRVRASN